MSIAYGSGVAIYKGIWGALRAVCDDSYGGETVRNNKDLGIIGGNNTPHTVKESLHD